MVRVDHPTPEAGAPMGHPAPHNLGGGGSIVSGGARSRLVVLLSFIIIASGVFAGLLARYYLASRAPAPSRALSEETGVNGAGDSPGGEAPHEGTGEAREPSVIPNPNFTLEGSTMLITGPGGDREWELEVGEVRISETDNKAELTGVEATRFQGGKIVFRVKAGRAIVDWKTRDLVFRGGVEVYGGGGDRAGAGPAPVPVPALGFRAAEAEWHADSEKLAATGDVEYWNGATTISGRSLSADARLQRVLVEGPARLVVRR
ncbi:MAG TPA: LPS export ABC transporter periplasmic protein LptC [Firmicutes bacterium]|nr:LPS export ABC transporter periplasmic protein LptC [Bacillota bacterium]